MLIISSFVRPLRRDICLRYQAFIDTTADLSYCVVPDGTECSPDRLLVAHYREEDFDQLEYTTDLRLPLTSGPLMIQSGLTDVMILLSFLADQPAWLERLRGADPHADDETVVRSFGIDPDATCRPTVGGSAEGQFLAPDAGGYAYFYVDTRGGVTVMSRSDAVLPVAFHLAADREAARVHIASRVGKTPLTPDDIRP